MIFRDLCFGEFLREIQNKKLLCIGAGQLFQDMLVLWDDTILRKIIFIADNNKQGHKINVCGNILQVDSVDNILKFCLKDAAILITSMYCKSIYEQLNVLLKDINIDCYIYPVMSLKTEEYEWVPTNKTPVIPKTIHYFWFGGNKIPEENRKCIESWKRYCPDYKIIKWTEDNYDITKCNYMLQAYENKKWGFVSDFARLDVLFEFGGIYLDTDVELIKSLDDLLYENAFVGFQRKFLIGTGLGCGCKKGEPLFKEMRDVYYDIHFTENGTLNLLACPYYQTIFLLKYGLKCNNTFQRIKDLSVFPTSAFDPQGYASGKISLIKNTYGIHHYSESWISEKQQNINSKKYAEVNYFR